MPPALGRGHLPIQAGLFVSTPRTLRASELTQTTLFMICLPRAAGGAGSYRTRNTCHPAIVPFA